MRINRIMMYVKDIGSITDFYIKYFGAVIEASFYRQGKEYSSHRLLPDNEDRLEIIHIPDVIWRDNSGINTGFARLAISVGCRDKVEEIGERLRDVGYDFLCEPHVTTEGFYESMVFDPEGNIIIITE